jgi:ligand-binding sensor domain-containing protein
VALRDSGEILRILKDGTRTVLARGLDHPTTLALDRDGGIWVACGDGSVLRLERPAHFPAAP